MKLERRLRGLLLFLGGLTLGWCTAFQLVERTLRP